MSFPIIGTQSAWEQWNNRGFGSWQMWFTAAYGSWMYTGYVKNNSPVFKKVNIGASDVDYDIEDWDFGLAVNTPESIFTYEQHEGYPDGNIGMGVVANDGSDTYLYLMGRSDPAPITDSVMHRFLLPTFEADLPGTILTDGTDPLNVNHICGITVKPGSGSDDGIFVVTNNRDGNEFKLRKYGEDGNWDGAEHAPTNTTDLSPYYIENNSLARVRGIGVASDGNILVFINSGGTSTSTKVLKFSAVDISYMGQTSWNPSLAASVWAHVVQSSEVFILLRGLSSNNINEWKTSIYYDRATSIPDANKSNFIIEDNLTSFGATDAIELTYEARDAFNIAVQNTPTKFSINGEDEDDASSWTDRVGGIQDSSSASFFDANGVPLAIATTVNTNSSGIATAYYKPMRSGSGTEIDVIDIVCPAE